MKLNKTVTYRDIGNQLCDFKCRCTKLQQVIPGDTIDEILKKCAEPREHVEVCRDFDDDTGKHVCDTGSYTFVLSIPEKYFDQYLNWLKLGCPQLQFKSYNQWYDVIGLPTWSEATYRVKPEEEIVFELLDKVEVINTDTVGMITARTDEKYCVGDGWYAANQLRKVNDE